MPPEDVGAGSDETVDPGAPAAGGDGGGSDAPVDLNQVVKDFEAGALEELNGTPVGDPGAGEGSGKGKGGGDSKPPAGADPDDPIEAFVQKNYQGNRQAAADALYASRAEAGRLARELDEARGAAPKASPRDAAAELKAAREADQDIQTLDREMKSIDTRNQQINARQVEIAEKVEKMATDISALDAELPHIDDAKEYGKKFNEVNRKRTDMADLRAEFNTNELRIEKNVDRKDSLKRELRRAEQDVKDRLDEQADQVADEKVGQERVRKAFSTAFDHYIKPFNLDAKTDADKLAYIRAATRTQLADYLDSLGSDVRGVDSAAIFEYTQKLIGAYATVHGMKAGAAPKPKPTLPPRKILTPPRPHGEPPAPRKAGDPPRTTDDILSDPDLVRRRAQAVFSAVGRGQARRTP